MSPKIIVNSERFLKRIKCTGVLEIIVVIVVQKVSTNFGQSLLYGFDLYFLILRHLIEPVIHNFELHNVFSLILKI